MRPIDRRVDGLQAQLRPPSSPHYTEAELQAMRERLLAELARRAESLPPGVAAMREGELWAELERWADARR